MAFNSVQYIGMLLQVALKALVSQCAIQESAIQEIAIAVFEINVRFFPATILVDLEDGRQNF